MKIILKNIVFANRGSYQQVLFFIDMCLPYSRAMFDTDISSIPSQLLPT